MLVPQSGILGGGHVDRGAVGETVQAAAIYGAAMAALVLPLFPSTMTPRGSPALWSDGSVS